MNLNNNDREGIFEHNGNIVIKTNRFDTVIKNGEYFVSEKISFKGFLIKNNLSHLLDKNWNIYEENGIDFLGYVEENDFIVVIELGDGNNELE